MPGADGARRWPAWSANSIQQPAIQLERSRLEQLGRNDLAAQVHWVAEQLGDGLGYDVESFGEEGKPIYIEVKTTRGPISTPFYISENERRAAVEKGPAFHIYRLFEFGTATKVYRVIGPLEPMLALEPIAYRA